MKALEYLKRLRESWGVLISEDGLKNLDEAITELTSLQDKITELENDNKELSKDFTHSKYIDKYKELEAPKSCDGCKYEENKNTITTVDFGFSIPPCFQCSRENPDRYEPKGLK